MRHPIPGAPPLHDEIEHTADLGIVVEAQSVATLFEKAALSLHAIMVQPAAVEARQERIVETEGGGWEDVFHGWLSEVLAVFTTGGFVAAEVSIEAIEPTRVRGTLRGEKFDPARHEFRSEVKAVTYHDLAVRRTQRGWRARVIFDV